MRQIVLAVLSIPWWATTALAETQEADGAETQEVDGAETQEADGAETQEADGAADDS